MASWLGRHLCTDTFAVHACYLWDSVCSAQLEGCTVVHSFRLCLETLGAKVVQKGKCRDVTEMEKYLVKKYCRLCLGGYSAKSCREFPVHAHLTQQYRFRSGLSTTLFHPLPKRSEVRQKVSRRRVSANRTDVIVAKCLLLCSICFTLIFTKDVRSLHAGGFPHASCCLHLLRVCSVG